MSITIHHPQDDSICTMKELYDQYGVGCTFMDAERPDKESVFMCIGRYGTEYKAVRLQSGTLSAAGEINWEMTRSSKTWRRVYSGRLVKPVHLHVYVGDEAPSLNAGRENNLKAERAKTRKLRTQLKQQKGSK